MYLRSTMGQDRLKGVLLMNVVHYDMEINYEDIIL